MAAQHFSAANSDAAMSLRVIYPSAPKACSHRAKQSAIVFSLDAGYLEPLKTFLHSLAISGNVADIPLILITEDSDLTSDPYCSAVFDRIEILGESAIQRLNHLAARTLPRPGKKAWTRATFLKWEVFRDYGFEQHLFLDADMLCLRPLDSFLEAGEADITGSVQFVNDLKLGPDGRVAWEVLAARLGQMLETDFSYFRKSLNSGVMLLNKRTFTPDFRDQLDDFVGKNRHVNEQKYISEFMKKSQKYEIEFVSSKWNFHEEFLWSLPPSVQIEFLSRIHILHYAGKLKPWKRDTAKSPGNITLSVWHNYNRAMNLHLSQLGLPHRSESSAH